MAGLVAIKSFHVTDDLDTSIQFGSAAKPIPDTYAGLQFRCSMRADHDDGPAWLRISPFGVNSGSHSHHQIRSIENTSGGAPTGFKDSPTSSIVFPMMHTQDSSDSFSYSPMVIDIMSYANSNTATTFLYKTGSPSMRGDQDQEGWNIIGSATYKTANKITYFSIDAYISVGGFRRGSTFDLYGYGSS